MSGSHGGGASAAGAAEEALATGCGLGAAPASPSLDALPLDPDDDFDSSGWPPSELEELAAESELRPSLLRSADSSPDARSTSSLLGAEHVHARLYPERPNRTMGDIAGNAGTQCM